MSRDEDIEDIIEQLQILNIRQASLLARLECTRNRPTEEAAFQIGDYVRVLNPRRLQQTRGTIIKIA